LLSPAFRWESLQRWDLGHNLLLSPAFRWESLQRWDFGFHGAISYHGAPSRSFLSHNGISAITKPFMNFSFTRWSFGYHGAFHELFLSHDGILAITEPFTNFFFHMIELWLSQSLSRTFSFTRWNSGYHEAFQELFTWLSPRDT
jgi:hypothetical protein